ncbi:MAG: BrnT family toxin [Deltaproteobacteria bacterium]|nr:BrnT family toxin [Deltaproteobacteria bacterium]MBI3294792.1 BrnT family toxin [Deltaproteobacteria bacterium]
MFEWDGLKSAENKKKHGISFVEALEIWQGNHITVSGIARTHDGEERSATIGVVAGVLYTAIWTLRRRSIRIISVRRARPNEEAAYKKRVV